MTNQPQPQDQQQQQQQQQTAAPAQQPGAPVRRLTDWAAI